MDSRLVPIQAKRDGRGNLYVLEYPEVDFTVKRIYVITSVPDGQVRGMHAHKKLTQLMWMAKGGAKIRLNDGEVERIVELHEAENALRIGPGIWRELFDFTPDGVLIVAASKVYEESDYIHNLNDFIDWKAQNG